MERPTRSSASHTVTSTASAPPSAPTRTPCARSASVAATAAARPAAPPPMIISFFMSAMIPHRMRVGRKSRAMAIGTASPALKCQIEKIPPGVFSEERRMSARFRPQNCHGIRFALTTSAAPFALLCRRRRPILRSRAHAHGTKRTLGFILCQRQAGQTTRWKSPERRTGRTPVSPRTRPDRTPAARTERERAPASFDTGALAVALSARRRYFDSNTGMGVSSVSSRFLSHT